MKLRFTQSISGTNFSAARGHELDVKDEVEAARFIAAGIAVEVKEPEYVADLRTIKRQLTELAQEVADLRVAIEASNDEEGEPAKKPPAKKG